MTTPDFLAHLPTAPRRHAQEIWLRTRLTETANLANSQRADSGAALGRLNNELDRLTTEAQRLESRSLLYPHDAEREQRRVEVTARLAELEREQPYAAALHAAATVDYMSATLEMAWLDRRHSTEVRPGNASADVVWRRPADVATAPGYTVTVLRPGRKPGDPWRETDAGTVRGSRVRRILSAWAQNPQAYVLRDRHGRLYVAHPDRRLTLEPADLAPPSTEGDALRAALAAYGFPAADDGEGGHTWLVVPVDPCTPAADAYGGLHFRISSGEDADRPASEHDEPWGASLYDANGEYKTTLDAAPEGSTLAEDCAHIARAIAEYALTAPRD